MRHFILTTFMIVLSAAAFSQTTAPQESKAKKSFMDYDKYMFGGYGSVLYNYMDYGADRYNPKGGAVKTDRAQIDIPRMVLEFRYKFRPDIEMVTEVEFEHGGTGSALELEYEEMGEYEMEVEKAGEVVLEQFWIKKTFSDAFAVKIGHMIVPIGNTNAQHIPMRFFGTQRPEGEMTILPLTWHETGIAILGSVKKWKYELQLVNGLDANGFSSANWVRLGHQGNFETIKMTNPAVVAHIENRSVKNLLIQASGYYGHSAANTAKPAKMDHIDGAVTIGHLGFDYNNQKLIARGNFIYGNLGDSEEISKINKTISNNIQYPRTPVAKNAMTYSAEIGYDVLSFFNKKTKLYPFVRYDYYNSMQDGDSKTFLDKRHKRQVFTFGFNYFLTNYLALKVDYSHRSFDQDDFNNENTLGVAMVFNAWFFKK